MIQGRGRETWLKHELMRRAAGAQIAALDKLSPGRGLIVDMHAGDGEGVEIADGQADLWLPHVSDSTAALACRFAAACANGADVLLCESHTERREALRVSYGDQPSVKVLRCHADLLRRDFSGYAWAFVFNDPNGPRSHGVEEMEHVARQVRASDFLIVVNEQAIVRHSSLKCDADTGNWHPSNRHMGPAAYATRDRYTWMLDADKWRQRLGKRSVAVSEFVTRNNAFHGRVVLVTNFVTRGVSDRYFKTGSQVERKEVRATHSAN